MMVPLTLCGSLAYAQEPQTNCVATATVPSQLKPQTSSPLQPQEVYGTYVPYTGSPVKTTSPQSEASGAPATCSAASAQTPAPSAQIPPPLAPKPQEEVVYGSYVPYKAPAPKADPPQVALNEAPPTLCSATSTWPTPPASTMKLVDDPVYGSYVPYTGPPVKTAASAALPASCFTPEAQSSHSGSTPAVARLEAISSQLENTIEAPHDLPPSAAAPSVAAAIEAAPSTSSAERGGCH